MGLISELKRRNVFRMAVLYVVAAWLVMQVAEVVVTLGALPSWTGRVVLLLLAIGFPIALVFSWFYELTPEGISLEKDVEPHESITHITGRRVDFIVISLLCAGLVVFAFDKWWPRGPIDQSIVVLPFANVSDDPNNEYFSDGISEDILNLLARVPELRVISRSSAFSFKGQNVDIQTIAAKLNVEHVLEGSVRKSNEHVRINAQLIDVESDTQLWSKSYDREMRSIFAIQDEIAAAIVSSLRVTLLGGLPETQRTDPKAYELYLRSKEPAGLSTAKGADEATRLLVEALAIDPEYAQGWAALATVQVNQAIREEVHPVEGFARAEVSAQRALSLDPINDKAMVILGGVAMFLRWDFETAHKWFAKARRTAPGSSDALNAISLMYSFLGQFDKSLTLMQEAAERDPLAPGILANLAGAYMRSDKLNDSEARQQLEELQRIEPASGRIPELHGWLDWRSGDFEGALRRADLLSGIKRKLRACALHGLGRFEEAQAELDTIKTLDTAYAFDVADIYGCWGDKERAFAWLERAYMERDPELITLRSSDLTFEFLHDDPRWETLLRKVGLADDQIEQFLL